MSATGYVVLCGCGVPTSGRCFYEPIDGRHVVALIDDRRPQAGLVVEPNPPVDTWTAAQSVNRRGDRTPLLRLPCPGCRAELPALRLSTAAAVIDWIVDNPDRLIRAIAGLGWTVTTDFREEDIPAAARDVDLMREQVIAPLFGEVYSGPEPQYVPRYVRRYVIPREVFRTALSNLDRDRI